MTKADLIEEVSRVVEMTRKESEVIVEAIFDSIVRSLRSGDKIEIRGFGSFRTRQRQPRVGRNPKTGARVEVPAKKIPYFKPSKELKDVVNNSAVPHLPSELTSAPHVCSHVPYGSSLEPVAVSVRFHRSRADFRVYFLRRRPPSRITDAENLVVWRGRLNFVLLNRYPVHFGPYYGGALSARGAAGRCGRGDRRPR